MSCFQAQTGSRLRCRFHLSKCIQVRTAVMSAVTHNKLYKLAIL